MTADGIVATKRVIPDDSYRYVASTACEIGSQTYPLGRIRLIIREAGAEPAAPGYRPGTRRWTPPDGGSAA